MSRGKKRLPTVFFMMLLGGAATAGVYKWVDESGGVHYADEPPEQSGAQPVEIPEGPPQAQAERARQQAEEIIQRDESVATEPAASSPVEKPSREDRLFIAAPESAVCSAPLSELVTGTSAQHYAPIAPVPLSDRQQRMLTKLFARFEARWRGAITDATCADGSSQSGRRIRRFEAETTVEWDARNAQLTIETELTGSESRSTKWLVQRFQVGEFLYYSELSPAHQLKITGSIALEGNKVEILALEKNRVSFLLKRRISTGLGTRIPRAEVRQLGISARTLGLVELYYHNALLTGSRTWELKR
ncbi:MAG: DUF4124 domain-containing protein [Gammaproteobacteria bacterium]|nr:DUF4124 domain-containing protein [Gammaproteobacteria bacterium]NIM72349.1 DUF4124 domain-containing protein [Gammaproteobacteria bacterium]NIN40185.1 DUF4124 domain-containing protein [Gammaproteobacteria bacterium]NIO24107.1 DUF4124 domain-containing protein [Gammaproteobacteria bacterium]NIO65595.1 DUF4124 domain-containing protein [Gammaproteobacteria bacterium]